jgi:hypothetical protein
LGIRSANLVRYLKRRDHFDVLQVSVSLTLRK